jgi:hypothetical protein
MNIGYILALVVGVPTVLVGLVMLVLSRGGPKRPSLPGIKVKPSRWRKAGIGVVIAVVGALVWYWLMKVGHSHPQLGLVVALVLGIVSFFVSKVKGFGWWLPFVWLVAACLFAQVSVNSGQISQPGSILTAFGNWKWLVLLTVVCVIGTIVMALVEQNKFTWLVVVVALLWFVGQPWYKLIRYHDQLTTLTLRGGDRNNLGSADFVNGVVTVCASSQAKDGVYTINSQKVGYYGETRLHNGDAVEVWLDSDTPMPHPESVELYIGSAGLGNGWVRPFDGNAKRFTGRAKNCWLQLRLPKEATGKYQFGMKILEK